MYGPSVHSQETHSFSMYWRHGDSIDVSYPHVGMVIIWLSDCPSWVRQWQYLVVRQCQLGMTSMWFAQWVYWKNTVAAVVHPLCQRETGRSHQGTRPGFQVSTCKTFDYWLSNPGVRGRDGSGPGRASGLPLECTWFMAKEEAHS